MGRSIDSSLCTNPEELVLGKRWLSEIEEEIRKVYLSDNRPWVIGYSGGKDSTAALQMVWNSLSTLPRKAMNKPVYVISSDTLVETPVIVDYINTNLEGLQRASDKHRLPLQAAKVKPLVSETYWVNLIGRGYPIPYSRLSRWCTDRLKIRPANRFILERVAQYGEVILVLGVRKSESSTRAQVINLHTIKGSLLKTHSTLPGAFVYAPIINLSTKDVWNYLLAVPTPWSKKNNNQYLFDLYKSAHSGECPLVIDKTTPSCGNSRFGCWVCTAVQKDHSMESLIESGEEWMRPLLEFRDYLSFLKQPAQKAKYRDHRRRDGKVYFKRNSMEIAWGQTTLRRGLPQILLRKLLKTQKEIQKHDADFILISNQELNEIRRLWRTEQSDWLDQVPSIYQEATGQTLDWIQDDLGVFKKQELDILEKLCIKRDVPLGLLTELLDLERQYHGMSKRRNIYKKMDRIINKDWRTLEEVIAQAD